MSYNETIQLLNLRDTEVLAAGADVEAEAPCIGRFVCSIFVFTQNEDVDVEISEGVNEAIGVYLYRDTTTITVLAGTALRMLRDITGTFIRVRILNNSVNPTNIEAYSELRKNS
jgi:hypothetical protein